ncbi:MAG: helix-turn-helix domain-containing protein [Bacteroidia bacterium]
MTAEIKTYDFKPGLPREFEIVNIAALYKSFKESITSTHRTGFYHIIWFQKGSPVHLVDFNPVKILPDTLLFLNKDIVQRFDSHEKCEGKVILFTDRFFCRTEADTRFLRNTTLFNDLFSVSQFRVQKQSKLFSSLLQLMSEELQRPKDGYQTEILQNLLYNFLLHSEREQNRQHPAKFKKSSDVDHVMLFRRTLDEAYKHQRQVSYYARHMAITEKRLNQATAKVLGKTPKELIDDRVMLEARRLLAHTAESIKEIGFRLGFEEATNFIKYFRKHSRSTPVEFRENNAAA